MNQPMYGVLGGFADLWLFSDQEPKFKPRQRDYRPAIVATYPCTQCGASIGESCRRRTVAGLVLRRLPHLGRGKPGRNDPSKRGKNQWRR